MRVLTQPVSTSPTVGTRTSLLWSMCLHVCLVRLFVCSLAYLENRSFKFHQISYVCYGWPRSFGLTLNDGNVVMLCTSGFLDDVMFSHNRANGQNQRRRIFIHIRSNPTPCSFTSSSRTASTDFSLDHFF